MLTMKLTFALLPLACFCLSGSGQCKSKKVAPPKKAKPAPKIVVPSNNENWHTPLLFPVQAPKQAPKIVVPPYNTVPPAGLYEVHQSIYGDQKENYTELFPVPSDLKWIRLYKNRTYKTNLSEKGKLEGHYFYKRKSSEIIWKAFK